MLLLRFAVAAALLLLLLLCLRLLPCKYLATSCATLPAVLLLLKLAAPAFAGAQPLLLPCYSLRGRCCLRLAMATAMAVCASVCACCVCSCVCVSALCVRVCVWMRPVLFS